MLTIQYFIASGLKIIPVSITATQLLRGHSELSLKLQLVSERVQPQQVILSTRFTKIQEHKFYTNQMKL